MRLRPSLISALVLASCAPNSGPGGPVPDSRTPETPSRVSTPPATSQVPPSTPAPVRDSATPARLAGDSALDAAMLDRIAEQKAPDGSVANAPPPEGEGAVLKALF
ncbi:MAG: hypothetical protein HOP28_00625, partial [Gemmatimonadales bacterium]|nr:hypothetical protein [Gemmatimonadales bacterium]